MFVPKRIIRFPVQEILKQNTYLTLVGLFLSPCFPSGPRYCIGQRFAQMEMIVILAHILSEFTIAGIDPEDERNICFEETIMYHSNNLKVNFRTRTRVVN